MSTIKRSDARRILCRAGYSSPDRIPVAVAIETRGVGGDWLYGAYQKLGDDQPTPVSTAAELWAAILARSNRSCVWYAHSAEGEADHAYLLPWVVEYLADQPKARAELIMQGQRVIGLVVHTPDRQRVELRDSHALLPRDLHSLAAAIAPDVAAPAVGIQRPVPFDRRRAADVARCHQTATALLAVLVRARGLIRDAFGVGVGWTIGSTAMRAFRHQLPADAMYWRLAPKVETWIRRAYHGGLVALTTINRTADATSIDVNSMYTSIMRRGVPYGTPTRVYAEVAGRPAFYRCDCLVPDDLRIPFLPYDDEAGRVLWPRGRFITTISSDEVLYARARGCRVDVLDGYVFPGLVYPFEAWANQLEQLRATYRGGAMEQIVKLFQNALYGKFGTRPTATQYRLYAGDVPDGWAPMVDPITGEISDLICCREQAVDVAYQHVHWAAWITAQARLKLMAAIDAIGARDVLYCDTDSVTARSVAIVNAVMSGAIVTGEKYGQWKVEHQYEWFHAGAPKEYVGRTTSGGYVVRAAGVPRSVVRVDQIIAALDGEAVSIEYQTTPSVVRRARGRWAVREARRGYSTLVASPNWAADADGEVWARLIDRGDVHIHE